MAAVRHPLRVRLFLSSQWRDFTDKVYTRNEIAISRGRPDEASEVPPQTCSLTLDNRTGEFSMRNPTGTWYGQLNRNVPLEVAYGVTTDSFTRTVSNGWGSDDNGNAWTVVASASNFAVTGGVGTITVPAATDVRTVYQAGTTYTDVDISASVTLAVTNITGALARPLNLVARGATTSSYVMASLRIGTDEAVTVSVLHADGTTYLSPVSTGITHTSSQSLSMRFQVEGAVGRVKVWVTSAGEPLDWTGQTTALLPIQKGFVGVRASTDSGNTNSNLVSSVDNFRVDSMRFTGEVVNWPSGSDPSNRDKYVSITAAGITRRLSQGQAPLMSALRRGILGIGDELRAYWPAEDLANSTSIASALGGPAMEIIAGEPQYAASDDFPGSLPIAKLSLSRWTAHVPWYDWSVNGMTQLRFLVSIPSGGAVDDTILVQIGSEGTAPLWQVVYYTGSGGQLAVKAYDPNGTLILTGGPAAFSTDGNPVRIGLTLDQVGANIDWALNTVNLSGVGGGISGTLNSRTAGRVDQVWVGAEAANLDDVGIGHITVESEITDIFTNDDELFGWSGEKAVDRMIRLCRENDVPFYWTDIVGDTPQMGPQRALTLLELLRECATTDGGTLHEPAGALGFAYRSRSSAYAQTARLTLDVSANEVAAPFQPVEDDQNTRNDVEVQNVNGSSARATLETGRMSVQSYPNGIGRYDTSVSVNVASDTLLLDQASWRLTLGTVDEARYPDLGIDLDAKPALIPSVLDVGIDDLIVVTNPSAIGIYDTIKQLARGFSETWTNYRGLFQVNASPYSPYDVETLDSNYRLDSGSSTLNEDLDTTETGVDVATSDVFDLWVTTAANPSEFPFDIIVGGERMTVTAITGATSPQTFTVTRSVNGVVKTHSTGAEVHVFQPIRLGL